MYFVYKSKFSTGTKDPLVLSWTAALTLSNLGKKSTDDILK